MEYYGTLGPACADEQILTAMFRAGMTGMRLNTSHGRLADRAGWIRIAQNAAAKAEKQWRLLIDLKGPELRIGHLERPIALKTGGTAILTVSGSNDIPLRDVDDDGDGDAGMIPIPEEIMREACPGQIFRLDDGRLGLKIVEVDRNRGLIYADVLQGGMLRSDKSLAIDGVEIAMPALTDMDLENIRYGAAHDIGLAAVMQPFVRCRQDLVDVRRALDDNGCRHVKIMAKIENCSGVQALPELLPFCDMIVIARGDLGTAVSLPQLPVVQKKIELICRQAGKPYMVVTQLLDSMIFSPVPTRAEVSDIAHAVFGGAAALMLTGETAAGKYPAEAVRYLVETAQYAENSMDDLIKCGSFLYRTKL